MKEIKVGEFVWHEEYGKGMCISKNGCSCINFEGDSSSDFLSNIGRANLFKKGDLVVGREGNSEIKGSFLGWSDYSKQYNNPFLVILGEGSTHSYFVPSLKHQEEPLEISVILKVNGKEVDPKSLSKETWENLRGEKDGS